MTILMGQKNSQGLTAEFFFFGRCLFNSVISGLSVSMVTLFSLYEVFPEKTFDCFRHCCLISAKC